jgi:hypothetical protein
LNGTTTSTNLKIQYTHCEIHPSTCLGVLASCIPFPHLNQAPRNTYQCAMAKQAIGINALNYDKRMDKTAYILNYPTRPLIDTRMMDFLQLNKMYNGDQKFGIHLHMGDGGVSKSGTSAGIAITILKQLGGMNRLIAMTGAYNFVDLGNGVAFKIKNQR